MTRIIKSGVLLLLLVFQIPPVFSQKMEYFRHLVFRESLYSDTKGIHQIDEKTAQKEAHYRFVYDDKNRVKEISHRIGKTIINDNGNWDSFMWFSSKMLIEYEKGKEIRYFYNRLDEQIEAHGKVYKAVFLLDENGNRTELKFYDKEGNESENEWGIHQYTWKNEGKGNIIEKRFNLKNNPMPMRPELIFFTIRLEYGKDDYLDFIHHIDDDGNKINNSMKAAVDRVVYDQEGNFSRWMVYDKDFKPVEGNAPQFALGEHLYDARGNKVELRGFDVFGRMKAMPDGAARILNTYDSFNNQVEIRVFDINDKLIQHIKREYSKDGIQLLWMKFYDSDGALFMHPQAQFAAMKFEYDSAGKMKGRKLFDSKMKELTTTN